MTFSKETTSRVLYRHRNVARFEMANDCLETLMAWIVYVYDCQLLVERTSLTAGKDVLESLWV